MGKEMAALPSILTSKTPWTEKPGPYSPWGHKSQTRLPLESHLLEPLSESEILCVHFTHKESAPAR